jgi:hypothetical protein
MNAAITGRFIVGNDYASGAPAPTSATVRTFRGRRTAPDQFAARSLRNAPARPAWFAKSSPGRDHFHFFRQAAINVIARLSPMNGIWQPCCGDSRLAILVVNP